MGSVAKVGMQATWVDVLKYQDELIRSQQFEYLGRMKLLVVEAADGASVANVETGKLGVRFDWYNEPAPKGGYVENFVPIAQSLDRRMLLCMEPLIRRHGPKRGTVGLPDIPDPNWKRPAPNPKDPNPEFENAPMIEQSLLQRGVTVLRENQNILVAQPLYQIMFQPEINRALMPTYWRIDCGFDPTTRTQMALLIDRTTGAAHFYGGKFEIVSVG
jgi:hypothetical protein